MGTLELRVLGRILVALAKGAWQVWTQLIPWHTHRPSIHPSILFLQDTTSGLGREPTAVPQFPPSLPPSDHAVLLQRLPIHQPVPSQPPQIQGLIPALEHQLGHGPAGSWRVLEPVATKTRG